MFVVYSAELSVHCGDLMRTCVLPQCAGQFNGPISRLVSDCEQCGCLRPTYSDAVRGVRCGDPLLPRIASLPFMGGGRAVWRPG